MDKVVCVHYIIERLKDIVASDFPQSGASELLREMYHNLGVDCLLYTSPSPRDRQKSRMPSSA